MRISLSRLSCWTATFVIVKERKCSSFDLGKSFCEYEDDSGDVRMAQYFELSFTVPVF